MAAWSQKVGSSIDYGPYWPCGAGTYQPPTAYDPLYNASVEQQFARFMNVAVGPFDLRHRCGISCGGTACMGGMDGFVEVVNWEASPASGDNVFYSGVLWHEVAHDHEYKRGAGACGYDSATYVDPTQTTNPHAAPNIIGMCLLEVLQRSNNYCGALPSPCAPGEHYLINGFDAASCECVPDVLGSNSAGSFFAFSSAVGDFDSDGFDDLAVGAPEFANGAGAVMRGTPTGLKYRRRIVQPDVRFKMFPSGNVGTMAAEPDDRFGQAVASADFNGDGYDDLAVGVSNENGGAGFVAVIPGTALGLEPYFSQLLDQTGLGASESDDHFGEALAAGRFDADSSSDLAVGVPDEVYGGWQSGFVMTFRGQSNGVASQHFLEPWAGFRDLLHGTTGYEKYGAALAASDLDGNGKYELGIGSPGARSGEGGAFVREFDGSAFVLEDYLKNPYAPSESLFGAALAIGNFRGAAYPRELAVGAPGESDFSGAVYVFEAGVSYRQAQYPLGSDEPGDRFGHSLARASLGVSGGYDTLLIGAPVEAFYGGPAAGVVFVFDGSAGGLVGRSILRQADLYNPSPSCPGGGCPATFIDTYGESDLANELFGWSVAAGNFNASGSEDVAVGSIFAYVLDDTFSSEPAEPFSCSRRTDLRARSARVCALIRRRCGTATFESRRRVE